MSSSSAVPAPPSLFKLPGEGTPGDPIAIRKGEEYCAAGVPLTAAEESEVRSALAGARIGLVSNHPFFATLVMRLTPVIAEPGQNLPTAGITVDGTLFVNPMFFLELTPAQRLGLLGHEVLHLILLFFTRLGARNMKVFNWAHDYVVNQEIMDFAQSHQDRPIHLPPGGLLNSAWRGKSAEEIYELLADLMRDAIASGAATENSSAGIGIEDILLGGSSTSDGKRAEQGDPAASKRIEDAWKDTLLQAVQKHEQTKGQGTLPGGIKLLVKELLEPKISWTAILSRWLGENGALQDHTWSRLSRRSAAMGVPLPGRVKYGVEDVVIIVDTSGSMYGRQKEFLAEFWGLVQELNLSARIIICDAAIYADVKDVREAEAAAELLEGGGGSDFGPAFARLEEESSTAVVIAFTDGYISVPSSPPPLLRDVIWVLWKTQNDVDPTHGKWGSTLIVDGAGNAVFKAGRSG